MRCAQNTVSRSVRVADLVEMLTIMYRDGAYRMADLVPEFSVGPDGFRHLRKLTCRMNLPNLVQTWGRDTERAVMNF